MMTVSRRGLFRALAGLTGAAAALPVLSKAAGAKAVDPPVANRLDHLDGEPVDIVYTAEPYTAPEFTDNAASELTFMRGGLPGQRKTITVRSRVALVSYSEKSVLLRKGDAATFICIRPGRWECLAVIRAGGA